ncbi:YbaK/EbsC family protein [Streptomyces sp. NPDC049879]|uniref:YbaK/EbsC family protein n=1 Tax=Streptomyces sp. NPDC049879 TaxID=3365598 RepID=UPI0037A60BFE
MRAPLGDFDDARPAIECLDLLPAPVAAALRAWQSPVPAGEVVYVDSDPEVADTAAFVATYGQDLSSTSANLVVLAGKRGGDVRLAACLVPSQARLDVNGVARRRLDVRKVSFAPRETAVGETGMEYGGITPVGLPAAWPLLVDASLTALPWVLVGSGARRGKLILPGKALAELPGAEVVEDLAR